MTLTKFFRNHIGKIIRIKKPLWWYQKDEWDEVQERLCVLLDVKEVDDYSFADDAIGFHSYTNRPVVADELSAILCLLIDGSFKFVLVSEEDVEVVE